MKRALFSLVIGLACALSTQAQEQGDIKLNFGVAYGTEAGVDGGGIGINVGGEYFVTDIISAAPSYTYFLKSTEDVLGTELSNQISSINIDGRYYFLTDDLKVYGLAGVSLLSSTAEVAAGGLGTIEVTANDTGLNIGGGIVLPFSDNLGLNGQLKYQTPGAGQLVINAGLVFSL